MLELVYKILQDYAQRRVIYPKKLTLYYQPHGRNQQKIGQNQNLTDPFNYGRLKSSALQINQTPYWSLGGVEKYGILLEATGQNESHLNGG